MTELVRVSCITKEDRYNPHERIQGIGGIHGGTRWWLNENSAISGIETGQYKFYVDEQGRRIDVIVASHNGRKYLKTVTDRYIPDNLLSLDSCPLT